MRGHERGLRRAFAHFFALANAFRYEWLSGGATRPMRALKPPFPRLWHGLECHWVCRGPPRPTCAIPAHTHVHTARKWYRNAAKPCKVGHAREPCQRRSVSLTWMPPPNRFPRLWHIQSLGNIFSQPTALRDRLAIARSASLANGCARMSFAVLELR